MISLKNIQYKAGAFSLDGIDHTFETGRFHIVLGPSGSGKSLLLEIISGLLAPDSGTILLNGADITDHLPEHRHIGYLPQDNVLFPHLDVKENIAYGLRIKNQKEDNYIKEIAEKLEITHLLDRKIQRLSGGEMQRISLARSLVAGNKVLLLDEPTSSLHHSLKNELCYLLGEIQEQFNLTVIMVTHDIESAFMLGHTITFLIDGKKHQTFSNLENNFIPYNWEVAKFLGIKNIFEGMVRSTGISSRIDCKALGMAILLEGTTDLIEGQSIVFGIKAEDVRIIFPERIAEYTNVPNRITGLIRKIYRRAHFLTLLFVPDQGEVIIEVQYPLTKANKIRLVEGMALEIMLKPDRIFILH
jgi:ABC-type sugar transport system ATPase subunit